MFERRSKEIHELHNIENKDGDDLFKQYVSGANALREQLGYELPTEDTVVGCNEEMAISKTETYEAVNFEKEVEKVVSGTPWINDETKKAVAENNKHYEKYFSSFQMLLKNIGAE